MGPEHGGTVDLIQNAIDYKHGNDHHVKLSSPLNIHHHQQLIHHHPVGDHHINTNGLHHQSLSLHGNGHHGNIVAEHNPVLTLHGNNNEGYHQQAIVNHHGNVGSSHNVLLNHHGNMESLHNNPVPLNLHDNAVNINHHTSAALDEKEGMKINRIGTGYPIYNLPTRPPKLHNEPVRIDQGMTDFVRPLPPVDGQNPYEVLTSASLGMDYPGVNENPHLETIHHYPEVLEETNHQPLKVVVSLKTKEQEQPLSPLDIQDIVRKRTSTVPDTKNKDTMPGIIRSIKPKHHKHRKSSHRGKRKHHRRHRHRLKR